MDEAARRIERVADRIAGQLRQAAVTAPPIQSLPTLQSQMIRHRHVAVDAARGRLFEMAKLLSHRSRGRSPGCWDGWTRRASAWQSGALVYREGDGRYDGTRREVTDEQVRDGELALAGAMRDAAQPSALLDALG